MPVLWFLICRWTRPCAVGGSSPPWDLWFPQPSPPSIPWYPKCFAWSLVGKQRETMEIGEPSVLDIPMLDDCCFLFGRAICQYCGGSIPCTLAIRILWPVTSLAVGIFTVSPFFCCLILTTLHATLACHLHLPRGTIRGVQRRVFANPGLSWCRWQGGDRWALAVLSGEIWARQNWHEI